MKKFAWLIIALFMISFVSASYDYDYKEKIVSTKYYPDEDLTITATRYVDYDNDDRYSTYDYRHGYTYRETADYWNKHHDKITYTRSYRDYDRNYRYDAPSYYYTSSPYLHESRAVECYNEPPRGKLFYIKCP